MEKKKLQAMQERRNTKHLENAGGQVSSARIATRSSSRLDQSMYSKVLKAMRRDTKLVNLGADVLSIKRTRIGEVIHELKRDKGRKSAVYKCLPEGVLAALNV